MTGNEYNAIYPMQWSEDGEHYFYDGDTEHKLSYARPPRIVYVAANTTPEEFERTKAAWDRWGFAVERKCP